MCWRYERCSWIYIVHMRLGQCSWMNSPFWLRARYCTVRCVLYATATVPIYASCIGANTRLRLVIKRARKTVGPNHFAPNIWARAHALSPMHHIFISLRVPEVVGWPAAAVDSNRTSWWRTDDNFYFCNTRVAVRYVKKTHKQTQSRRIIGLIIVCKWQNRMTKSTPQYIYIQHGGTHRTRKMGNVLMMIATKAPDRYDDGIQYSSGSRRVMLTLSMVLYACERTNSGDQWFEYQTFFVSSLWEKPKHPIWNWCFWWFVRANGPGDTLNIWIFFARS